MKQAASEADETEAAIQASLAAALEDLDHLERVTPRPVARDQQPRVLPRVPRGMPPLPHGRVIPPLPVSRTSLLPRLIESLRPKAALAKPPVPEPAPRAVEPPSEGSIEPRRRSGPVVLGVLFVLALLAAALWWVRLR